MKSLAICFFCIILISISCKKKEEIQKPTPYYLEQWTGEYEGVSHHFHRANIGASIQTWSTYKNVLVNVEESNVDSSLNLIITYDDTIISSHLDLKMSTSGVHLFQSGGGSTHRELLVQFKADSIDYSLYQACGIWCESKIDFKLKKN